MSGEPAESTGWANFESFESTTGNAENKKPVADEHKEKMDTTDSIFGECVAVRDNNEESEDFVKKNSPPSEADTSAAKTDLNKSASAEEPSTFAVNVTPKEADRYDRCATRLTS